jgi:hypothetical protein
MALALPARLWRHAITELPVASIATTGESPTSIFSAGCQVCGAVVLPSRTTPPSEDAGPGAHELGPLGTTSPWQIGSHEPFAAQT